MNIISGIKYRRVKWQGDWLIKPFREDGKPVTGEQIDAIIAAASRADFGESPTPDDPLSLRPN